VNEGAPTLSIPATIRVTNIIANESTPCVASGGIEAVAPLPGIGDQSAPAPAEEGMGGDHGVGVKVGDTVMALFSYESEEPNDLCFEVSRSRLEGIRTFTYCIHRFISLHLSSLSSMRWHLVRFSTLDLMCSSFDLFIVERSYY
jgi:hypothetical protein